MERALELDPEYGLAWAGIAEAHVILGYYGLITPELARTRAVPAAEKAVQFAPDVGDAHCALGITLLMCDYEARPRAASAFARGMSLGPTAQGATWYHYFYLGGACGRLEDGLAGLGQLIANDELSPYLHGMLALLLTTRRDAQAPESAMRALGLEPDAFLSHFAHQGAAAAVNDWSRSLAAGEALFALGGRTPNPLAWYALALNRSGNGAGARGVLEELVTLTNHGERAPWALACVAAELGDTDRAVAWARDAVRRRDPMALAIMRQPPEQALRALDAWPEIEAAMRLPVTE
jgi:tetratricopeptide (TPR) repeat protein